MRAPLRTLTVAALAGLAACGGGSDGGSTGPSPAIAIALSPASFTATAGTNDTTTVTLTRTGGYTGDVTLSLEGAPGGVTGSFSPATVSGGTATSTLVLASTTAAAAGSYSLTVRAHGTGVTDQTATLGLTLTAAPTPAFTLAAAPASLSLQAGGSATTTLTVARSGGFTGAVAVAASGAPAGVTVTANPTSITGTTATVTVATTATAAPGTYNLTFTGSGSGVTSQTATVSLQVTAPTSTSTNVTMNFCAADAPVWLAVQDGTGAWQKVSPTATTSGSRYTFALSASKAGVAYVTGSSTTGYDTEVLYATTSELSALGASASDAICSTGIHGTKTVNGSVAGLGATDMAQINLGPRSATLFGATASAFHIDSVPDGNLDLIATRATVSTSGGTTISPNEVIIRRGLNPANGSTLPVLDFASSEAFAPTSAALTIGNLNGDSAAALVSYSTQGGGSVSLFTGLPSTSATRTYFGVPTDKQQAGELHNLLVYATPGGSSSASRLAYTFFQTVADRTVTLGPALSAPTISEVGTSPVRLRAVLPMQSAYNGAANVSFSQSGRTVTIFMTAAYAGGSSYDLTTPDLSAAQYDATWALASGAPTTWDAAAFGGTFSLFLPGGAVADGATATAATLSGTVSPNPIRIPVGGTLLHSRNGRARNAPLPSWERRLPRREVTAR